MVAGEIDEGFEFLAHEINRGASIAIAVRAGLRLLIARRHVGKDREEQEHKKHEQHGSHHELDKGEGRRVTAGFPIFDFRFSMEKGPAFGGEPFNRSMHSVALPPIGNRKSEIKDPHGWLLGLIREMN